MHLEVEQKFHAADLAEIRRRLELLGARFKAPIDQADTYFAHPARDFATTDEALRLRRVGEENFITYKGPRLDPLTKTRRELELPLPAGVAAFDQHAELLLALGFRAVATVHKRREAADLTWHGVAIEAALDAVAEVGRYVELEATADEAGLEAARSATASLAAELGLADAERRSYLELLLAKSP
jgi:adenylate cyclase class 2